MSFRTIASTTVLALTAGVLAFPAAAAPVSAPPLVQLAQAAFPPSEQDLAAFAAARITIQEIQTAMLAEAQAAAPEDVQRIQAEAQAEMVSAVEAEGITVEQYNAIIELAATDPDVANAIEVLIQQQLGG